MNDRFRQLAEQVKVIMDGDDDLDFFTEKFAELIVRECISMADEFEMNVNRSGLVDRMKEHFGVEK